MSVVRCAWAGTDPLMVAYHDDEWGVPVHDDRRLFEKITLEGAQSGLAWRTILHKREGYRAAFAGFVPERVARFGPADVERLMEDTGIVRNRMKITSTIDNAAAVLRVQQDEGSLDAYLWGWVDGTPLVHGFGSPGELPGQTELSKAISKDLKRRGFRFVGPTTVYAMMQSVGLVNDHTVDCYRHAQLAPR